MAAQLNFKSIGDFGYAVNKYGILRIDNVLAFLDSRIDEYLIKADGHIECNDLQGSRLDGQRWILSSANLKLSPFFNRCKFGSLHDVTIKLDSKQPTLQNFTCKVWLLNGSSEEKVCTAKIVKALSSSRPDNFALAKQVYAR